MLDPRERRREVERRLVEVGLEDAAGPKVRDSGSMRRRIGTARALLGYAPFSYRGDSQQGKAARIPHPGRRATTEKPPMVIVDEPTTGLDMESRRRLRESLLAVAGERIIIFSTHLAGDVGAAAARVLLLDHGRLLFDGPASGLIDRARGRVFEALVADTELRELARRYRVTTRVRKLDGIHVRAVANGDEPPPGSPVEPNLEEAYLAVIGEGRRGWRAEQRRGSLLDLDLWRDV